MEAESTFDRLIAAMPRNAEPVFMFLVAFNLLAMSGDIVIAHSYNEFALWGQYIPLGAGLVAGVVALYAAFSDAPGTRAAATTAMLVSVALGIAGFYWHIESQIVHGITLRTFVYTAPLVAPLAYSGIGLIGLLALHGRRAFLPISRRRLMYLLIGAGSMANALLSALDHARNAFINGAEWVSIPVSLLAGTVFIHAGLKDRLESDDRIALWTALTAQFVTGLAGFGFHAAINLASPVGTLIDKIIYGPPIFSPLLLCDLSTMGVALLLTTFEEETAAAGTTCTLEANP